MKRKSVYTCLVMLLMSLVLQAKDKDVAVAEALLKRLLPSYIESFQFQKLKGEKDCFTIESVKDKIVIGGNNANSMAMGLNHYLKYYCLTTVSWYADIAVEIPEELPMVGRRLFRKREWILVFFLNYCTYGYTMPWWLCLWQLPDKKLCGIKSGREWECRTSKYALTSRDRRICPGIGWLT